MFGAYEAEISLFYHFCQLVLKSSCSSSILATNSIFFGQLGFYLGFLCPPQKNVKNSFYKAGQHIALSLVGLNKLKVRLDVCKLFKTDEDDFYFM